VRDVCKFSNDLVGVKLMRAAFDAKDSLPSKRTMAGPWGRNVLGLRVGAYRAYAKNQGEDADLLIVRANTHGEWSPFKPILVGGSWGPQADASGIPGRTRSFA
jgi:hypothetical protein